MLNIVNLRLFRKSVSISIVFRHGKFKYIKFFLGGGLYTFIYIFRRPLNVRYMSSLQHVLLDWYWFTEMTLILKNNVLIIKLF